MPTNKPMKNQWIEVDGRLIPSTLPQHWNGNDWAITGTDNPLPVANYTKKGSLWLPTSEDNPVPTQVIGSIVERVSLTEQAGTVPAGTWKRIIRDDDGNELRDIRNNTDAISASLFFRRESGELADAVIAFGGYLSVEREPSLEFNFIRPSPNSINQSHKLKLLTNDFVIWIKAGVDDLIPMGLILYLWKR